MIASAITTPSTGNAMHELVQELFPLFRSITGDGVRQTLQQLRDLIPLEIHEVPTGTQVFDWTVPEEWNVRSAWIADDQGRRIIDIADSNLHLVNYSVPVNRQMTWAELKPHLRTLPDRPEWVPYRTAYFEETWGFCLSHRQFCELDDRGKDQIYTVHIDANRTEGSLTYGELFLPGETEDEILISTHVCHPSLANDNLAGIAVATFLAKQLVRQPHRYSYRFLFIPATIGAITWLSVNQQNLSRIKHGLILALLGDAAPMTYKRSRRGNSEIDRAAAVVLRDSGDDHTLIDYEPIGYDERQFCSPGINLPMGCLMRSRNGMFPEYHTSADNLEFVRPEFLEDSLNNCEAIFSVVEQNRTYLNLKPYCEPRLGNYGLYQTFGREPQREQLQRALLWVLNCSDGSHSLLDIAERSEMPFSLLNRAAELLLEHGLLSICSVETDNIRQSDSGTTHTLQSARTRL